MFGMVVDQAPMYRNSPKFGPSPRRRQSSRRNAYAEAGIEPNLEELLNDPVIAALMRCDGVSAASLRLLISETRRNLHSREPAA